MESIIRNKIIYFIVLLTLPTVSMCSYGKSIDLNGVRISISAETTKESINKGTSVNEDNKFSQTEFETKKKELEDKNVKIELKINNNNPYETANVTIEEMMPVGFRQLDNSKNEKVINAKIDSNSEKIYKYNYRYHKSFLKDQHNSINYDEDGNIIDNNTEIEISNNSNKNNISVNERNKNSINKKYIGSIEEEAKDVRKGAFKILMFLVAFLACVLILIAFLMFYRTMRDNDDFFNDRDSFNCLIFFVTISLIINILFLNKNTFAKTYEPQIYEYGKSYEKVIYEPVYFNDGLYRFAYKITVSFDNTYEITDEDYEKDTDGDGLIDAFEYMYMTDKENVDTDGDGLNDYIEVLLLDYNPLSEDTFNDGIKDGDRDFDNDKLTNIEEVRYGSDLTNVDTDYDTLTDYNEISIYNTDPLNIDTDEDLLIDPDELKLGLDPTNPRTDGVTLDSERKIKQKYTMTNVPEDLRKGDIFIKNVSGSVSGNIDNEVRISKKNEEVFNSMSSFVQSGFKVELKEDEKIDIELDVSKVSDRRTTLIIVKYDNGVIEAIDTICDGDSLKANVGSGTYSVMDSDMVLKDFNIMISDYMP